MKLMPMGDYYAWYCEWCDSKNLTLWTRFEKRQVSCGACHKAYPLPEQSHAVEERSLSRVI